MRVIAKRCDNFVSRFAATTTSLRCSGAVGWCVRVLGGKRECDRDGTGLVVRTAQDDNQLQLQLLCGEEDKSIKLAQ